MEHDLDDVFVGAVWGDLVVSQVRVSAEGRSGARGFTLVLEADWPETAHAAATLRSREAVVRMPSSPKPMIRRPACKQRHFRCFF